MYHVELLIIVSGINIDGVLLTGQQFAYDGIPLVSLCRLRVGVLL